MTTQCFPAGDAVPYVASEEDPSGVVQLSIALADPQQTAAAVPGDAEVPHSPEEAVGLLGVPVVVAYPAEGAQFESYLVVEAPPTSFPVEEVHCACPETAFATEAVAVVPDAVVVQ